MYAKIFKNKCELLLAVLFIFYLIIGNGNDTSLAMFIDIPHIKGFIVIITILLFIYCNKIVGILGLFVAYELLNFSHSMLNSYPTQSEMPIYYNIESKKSIEEEIVYKMSPCLGSSYIDNTYKPFSNDIGFFF